MNFSLKEHERFRFETIRDLVMTNGNKKRAELKLCCSRRTIDRYIEGYRELGEVFFIHGNRGRKPAKAIPEETKKTVIELYKDKYYGATFAHFSELLNSAEGIKISKQSIHRLLLKNLIVSPLATRKTRKKIKAILKKLLKEQKLCKKESSKLEKQLMTAENPHPRRPRMMYFGEMLQMDASEHEWFGGITSHLHAAIDDSTGYIVGCYFDKQETLNGYYNVFAQVLKNYGIPYMFYTDRRAVFEFKRYTPDKIEKDFSTQFEYACKQLGVEIKTTSVPQAKGRIERLFGTLQFRLPILFRLNGITTIEQANKFLPNFVKEFNKRFGHNTDGLDSVFENAPSEEKINLTLSVLTSRQIDAAHSVKFNNKYFRLLREDGKPIYFYKGTKGLVIKTLDGNLYFTVNDSIYALEEISFAESRSKYFQPGASATEVEKKKIRIPPMSHPYKKESFEKYLFEKNFKTN